VPQHSEHTMPTGQARGRGRGRGRMSTQPHLNIDMPDSAHGSSNALEYPSRNHERERLRIDLDPDQGHYSHRRGGSLEVISNKHLSSGFSRDQKRGAGDFPDASGKYDDANMTY